MAFLPVGQTYYEILDSESPSTIQGTEKGGISAVMTFLVDGEDILKFIKDMLGSVRLFANSYLRREMPAMHPVIPACYASKIVQIKGYSPQGKADVTLVKDRTTYKNIDTRSPKYVGSYKTYKITVQFETRQYTICSDADIDKFARDKSFSMPVPQPSGNWDHVIENFRDHNEYLRYTTWNMQPKTELLTWGQGNYVGINPIGAANNFVPIQQQTSGVRNILLQKYEVDWDWYFVPYELTINNKIWTDAYSKINLNPLYPISYRYNPKTKKFDDLYWVPEGTILFQKVEVKKYEPYYPFETIQLTQNSSVYDYFTEFNRGQYCDVRFKLLWFMQPDGLRIPIGPNNVFPLPCKDTASWHNRLPDPVLNLWYYVESQPATIVQQNPKVIVPNQAATPIYWSYPLENLFNYQEGA